MDLVREFLTQSFVAAGGVVEDTPSGIASLLPEPEAVRLGLAEEAVIMLAAEPAAGGRAVDGRLGSALLERMVAARLAAAPVAAVALPAELPRSLPEGLPVLLNAVRGGHVERMRSPVRFLVAELRLTLQGEELRSALASVTVRLEDGARVTALELGGAYPVSAAPLDDREQRAASSALRLWLRRDGPRLLGGALETLARRAQRDLERMAEYYASLDAEMARATERARADDERQRRRAKWQALATDLAARRGQLRERMRGRLAAKIVAATLVETIAERFTITVRRRSQEGQVVVLCRAADGSFDGPACAACGTATLRLYLCDHRLHVLCEGCGQAGRLDSIRCPACTRRRPEALAVSVEDPTASLRLGVSVW